MVSVTSLITELGNFGQFLQTTEGDAARTDTQDALTRSMAARLSYIVDLDFHGATSLNNVLQSMLDDGHIVDAQHQLLRSAVTARLFASANGVPASRRYDPQTCMHLDRFLKESVWSVLENESSSLQECVGAVYQGAHDIGIINASEKTLKACTAIVLCARKNENLPSEQKYDLLIQFKRIFIAHRAHSDMPHLTLYPVVPDSLPAVLFNNAYPPPAAQPKGYNFLAVAYGVPARLSNAQLRASGANGGLQLALPRGSPGMISMSALPQMMAALWQQQQQQNQNRGQRNRSSDDDPIPGLNVFRSGGRGGRSGSANAGEQGAGSPAAGERPANGNSQAEHASMDSQASEDGQLALQNPRAPPGFRLPPASPFSQLGSHRPPASPFSQLGSHPLAGPHAGSRVDEDELARVRDIAAKAALDKQEEDNAKARAKAQAKARAKAKGKRSKGTAAASAETAKPFGEEGEEESNEEGEEDDDDSDAEPPAKVAKLALKVMKAMKAMKAHVPMKTKPTPPKHAGKPHFAIEWSRNQVLCRTGVKGDPSVPFKWDPSKPKTREAAISNAERWVAKRKRSLGK